jgi:hypothetical protein
LGAFALDFWLFDVGGLWKGKGLLKGKWIAKGKVLKGDCWRGEKNLLKGNY